MATAPEPLHGTTAAYTAVHYVLRGVGGRLGYLCERTTKKPILTTRKPVTCRLCLAAASAGPTP